MFRRIVVSIVPGILTSLITAWLLDSWSNLDGTIRLVIAIVIGALTVVLLIFLNPSLESAEGATRIVWGIRSRKGTIVRDIEVDSLPADAQIIGDIKSGESVRISQVRVGTQGQSDARERE